FADVLQNCKYVRRAGQKSCWIIVAVERAHNNMHERAPAHGTEVWRDGQLVGGLYGIRMGRVFFGESMFSIVSNASRYAFIKYVQQLKSEGVELIDCQVYTEYLESMGAREIERSAFVKMVGNLI